MKWEDTNTHNLLVSCQRDFNSVDKDSAKVCKTSSFWEAVEPRAVGDKEAYVVSEDESFVFMRPKAQVGSSKKVWLSEDFEF